MKILMTADTLGGVWTYACELASWLAARGAEVTIATMGAAPSSEQRDAIQRTPGVELVESTYRLEWQDDPWDDVARAGDWLLGVEARARYDVVHLNGYAHGALPWRAPAMIVAHSCVLSWWTAVHREAPPPSYDRYRDAVTRGLGGVGTVVAPTLAMLRSLGDHYGPLPHGRVIPNGAHPTRALAGPKASFVLSAGRLWDRAKNLGALVEAAFAIPWPVFVAGRQDGPDRPSTTERVTEPASVRALGHIPPQALRRWMADAAIYALPAYYEPFGLSILEAALSGCALVLGDIPSLRETWGDAAVYVAPRDHAALGDALRRLIDDRRLRSAMSTRARMRARLFTADRMGLAYLSLYREITCAPASPLTHAAGAAPQARLRLGA